jgi:hypothetical protein
LDRGFCRVVFGLVNFWLLARIVRGMVQAEKVKKWKTLLFFFLKIGLIVLIIGLILEKAYVSPLPFLGGLYGQFDRGDLRRLLSNRISAVPPKITNLKEGEHGRTSFYLAGLADARTGQPS